MIKSRAVDLGQQFVPEQVERIEISRSVSDSSTVVRVYVSGAAAPFTFQFESMSAAIEFYERIWPPKEDGDEDASNSA
jgi:hypothetical protein